MGSWGLKSFDNDDAMDFLLELEDDFSVIPLVKALVADESASGAEGIAAAEILCALFSEPRIAMRKEAKKWLKKANKDEAIKLISPAYAYLQKLLDEEMDLPALIKESDLASYEQWKVDLEDLFFRIGKIKADNRLSDCVALLEFPKEYYPDFDDVQFSEEIRHLITLTCDKLKSERPHIEIYSVCIITFGQSELDGKKVVSKFVSEVCIDTYENYLNESARWKEKLSVLKQRGEDENLTETHGRWEVPGRFETGFFSKTSHKQKFKQGQLPWPLVIECVNRLVQEGIETFCQFKVHAQAEISMDSGMSSRPFTEKI